MRSCMSFEVAAAWFWLSQQLCRATRANLIVPAPALCTTLQRMRQLQRPFHYWCVLCTLFHPPAVLALTCIAAAAAAAAAAAGVAGGNLLLIICSCRLPGVDQLQQEGAQQHQ
jgi:hypothetical protein